MRGSRMQAAVAFVLLLAPYRQASADVAAPRTAAQVYQEARVAHALKDFPKYLGLARELVAMRPRNPTAAVELARAYAVSGVPDSAGAVLERLAAFHVFVDVDSVHELATLSGNPPIERARRAMDDVRRPAGSAVLAFTLADSELAPEGIACDPRTGTFFVSSIRKRKIVRIGRDGAQTDFVPPGAGGLWGVYGMSADTTRRRLWAGSSASPEVEGCPDSIDGRAGLFLFDLDTGRLVRSWPAPVNGRPHSFNDLAVGTDGSVYVTDSREGAVYRLGASMDSLEVLVPPGKLISPNGVVVSSDGSKLVVADYPRELYSVNLASGEVREIEGPADFVLHGIDGLARSGELLVAEQNGVDPNKVLALRLDAACSRVVEARVLELGDPRMAGPTLGTLVGRSYYFIANSAWEAFSEDRHSLVAGRFHPSRVLKIDLDRKAGEP